MADTKLAKIGLTPKEPWAADISYEVLDVTLYSTGNGGDGCSYVAMRDNIGVTPGTDDSAWLKLSQAGQSIYDLAVKYHHFDGTEEEFEQQYQAVLQAARDAATATLATNTAVQNAETLRVAAEQGRVSAESARADAEALRASAELTRENNETARGNAESVRVSAESGRVTAENGRVSAESARVTAESERASAETARRSEFESLESDMQTAIGQADAATAAAVALNEEVAGDEADRVTAETARETAESGRVSAESARVTAENGRVSAESGRVSAESARVSAETARVAQASSDHTRAESDHGTAATDHTTAGADHTQAGADHTASEASTAAANTAAAAADAARESIQDDLARKANIDGSYDTMSVGIAKNLEGRTDVTGSFLERTTGGDAEVANGLAQMQEVGGKSQVWNQLALLNGNGESTARGITLVKNRADGKATCNGTVDMIGNYQMMIVDKITFPNGHKLYIGGCPAGGDNSTYKLQVITNNYSVVPWTDYGDGLIQTWDESYLNLSLYIHIYKGVTVSNLVFIPQVIDLTLLFGSGNEPETVEEFEAWLASNIGLREHYPYNAGTVLNVNMTGIETLGFNLLDPATGKARIIGAYSDVYGNYYGITGTHGAITFTSDLGETSTITPDSDGKFLLEEPGELTVADAGADCSVFLWWDGTKTEHEDYERTVTNLDVAHIYGKLNGEGDLVRVWPTGIPGIGDVKDSLKVVDGAVVAERKVGEVVIDGVNNLVGEYNSNESADRVNYSAANNLEVFHEQAKYLIDKFVYQGSAGTASRVPYTVANTDVAGYNRMYFFFPHGLLQSATEVNTWFSNNPTTVYYELATPQTYTDLVYQGSSLFADGTPVTMPTNYPVNNWSVERIVPQNTSEAVVTTAPELTCRYSIDAVETLNTHADEIENLYDELDELDAKKSNKVGDYPGLSVGTARNLSAENAVPAEYVFRKTPDGAATGIATVQRLKGKSVVWNQIMNNRESTVTSTFNGTYRYSSLYSESINLVGNHIYYISADVDASSVVNFQSFEALFSVTGIGNYAQTSSTIIKGRFSCLLTSQYTANTSLRINCLKTAADGGTESFTGKNLMIIDLTLMFGAGNEPTTVAEFEAMYSLPYYDYNPGEIINNEAEAIETVGFNQLNINGRTEYVPQSFSHGTPLNLDETIYYSGITANDYYNQLRASVNIQNDSVSVSTTAGGYGIGFPVRVLPDTTYCLDFSHTSNWDNFYRVGFYGADKIQISYSIKITNTFTTPAGCYWVVIVLAANSDTTCVFSNILCNISDAARNGQYEPYEKHTLQLGLDAFDVKDSEDNVITVNGLKSAGSVFDEIDLARGKYIKRVGMVDMGTLEWARNSYSSGSDTVYAFYAPLERMQSPNCICEKYSSSSSRYGVTMEDKCVSTNVISDNVYVRDDSYSDAATFKTAMSGVILYYELAEPVEYDLVNPIQTNYDVISGGTERRLPEDTASSVLAPIAYDVVYALDAVGILTGLPQNYVSKESLQAMLNAMQSAGIFSAYTMTWDATNQRYTFTFTNNS